MRHPLSIPIITASVFLSVFIMYLFTFNSFPYEFYVQVDSREIDNACVGDDRLTYTIERTTRWGLDIPGGVWAQIIKYEGQKEIETTIFRLKSDKTVASNENLAPFGYEAFPTKVEFDTLWSEPFLEPGVYGVNEWITIYPFPFVQVTHRFPGHEYKFEVIECKL